MNYLRIFIPWIAYAAVSAAGWQWGASAGLLLGAGLLFADRAAGLALGERLLDYGTLVFFAALTALAFLRPDSPLQDYGSALSAGWLALISWGSIAVGRPFTMAIARRVAPPEVWHTALFRRINVVLTAAWAAAFTLTALAQTAVSFYGLGIAAAIALQVAGIVLPARFSATYPERVRARYLQKYGARGTAPSATAGSPRPGALSDIQGA